jgi:hypothetical protein
MKDCGFMVTPKVFISYSHDSQDHKKWVLDLATRLRNTGVDAILDQWELKPGDDLPQFMETHLADSDNVLMICTDRYVKKANSGAGGVGYEKMIITSDLIKNINSDKVIPIIRQQGTHHVPIFLKTKLFIDFSHTDEFEFSYDELIRTLHNSPLYVKPEIGNSPFTAVEDIRPEKTGDSLKELMTIVIQDYERGAYRSNRREVVKKMGISRVMFDLLVDEAYERELISQSSDGDLLLERKGKFYAIEHKIINA